MKTLLVGPLCRRVPSDYDFVVAIDGGVNACLRSRITPDLAIGDWDSFRGKLGAIPSITLPRQKARSDLHYALRAAAAAYGATEVHCLGLTGGRPDHHWAGIHEMAQAAAKLFSRVTASDENAEYHFVSGLKNQAWKARLRVGTTVSVLPVGGDASGVTLEGFEYPLRAARLQSGSQGLSNVVDRKTQSVRVKKGNVVIIISKWGKGRYAKS